MMRIALCDDQAEQLVQLYTAVNDFVSCHHIGKAIIEKYSNPLALLDAMKRGERWDICILDVCMPGIDGIELAKEIRKKGGRTEIIFISVSPEFAVDAFCLNAVHYVLKPFRSTDFEEAMNRALASVRKRTSKLIPIQLKNGIVHSVSVYDIFYIESISYRRIVHTRTGVYEEQRRTLSGFCEILDEMAPGQFIQPYRGYIVNLSAIRVISPTNITLINNDTILIKRGDFRKLRKTFLDWTFEGCNSVVEDS